MAAALAYSAIFALAPLLVIAVGVAGFFVGATTAQAQIYAQVFQATNRDVADFVLRLIEPSTRPANNLFATVIGVATLIWGATGMFVQIRDAINEMWGIPSAKGLDLLAFVRKYGLSMVQVFAAGALLFLMIVASAYVSQVHEWLGSGRVVEGWLVRISEFGLTLVIAVLLFMIVYRVAPDRSLPWRDTAAGAIATALLFSIGKLILAQYLTHFAPGSAFGAAGALVVLLVWVHYSAQIFFFGAALTHVWSERRRLWGEATDAVAGVDEFGESEAPKDGRLPPPASLRARRSTRP
jgi:membrane protein